MKIPITWSECGSEKDPECTPVIVKKRIRHTKSFCRSPFIAVRYASPTINPMGRKPAFESRTDLQSTRLERE
jgi:5-methylcytosine-specific restriction endonuclease McrA